MRFEYDKHKSETNLTKHGIDFEEAQGIWDDPDAITFPLEYGGEDRRGIIGALADGCWTGIYTIREERVRIISVRRSTPKEVSTYDRENNH